jgi:hypothetical protein
LIFLVAIFALSLPLAAAPISPAIHAQIMRVADIEGVPRSVANWTQVEESGNYLTGAWGDASAINRDEPGGWPSVGLFQIYLKPDNINELLAKYWYAFGETEAFNPMDPIHSAKLGLRYLVALHRQYGTWLAASAHYNGGSKYSWIRAKRICDAKEP